MKLFKPFVALLATCTAAHAIQPFTAEDLVRLERPSDPRLSTDGRFVAYQLRQTDWEGNRGRNSIWIIDLEGKPATPRQLTDDDMGASSPRWWSSRIVFFLSAKSGRTQVWRQDTAGGKAVQVTDLPLDVAAYAVAPNGNGLLLAMDVFTNCRDLACTRKRLDQQAAAKTSGQVYDRLFMRHWDTWRNGTRSQLFYAPLDSKGRAGATPTLLTAGLDADVPTKPFGGDEEFTFSADSQSAIFTARVAGRTEPWSTNTELWIAPVDGSKAPVNLTPDLPGYDTTPAVSPDGKTLAWLSMERAGFEADRNRVMLLDMASGKSRELAKSWDISPRTLQWSPDGTRIFATADELGQTPLFSIDLKGNVGRQVGVGSVGGYSIGKDLIVYALDALHSPAQVFSLPRKEEASASALTKHNAELLSQRALGTYEQFKFRGWNKETVYGYVMKPADYKAGTRYPVAFLIHGGPQGSFGNHWHYRWNPQTYAGQGYAVVFIDFHGSTGYGQAFTDSISGDWGGKPLVDLQKGWAHALKAFDFLDGDRACALGASYGGYMANWIAGNWPDAFKCIVNHDGIFDNRSMAYTTEELWFQEWEFGGTPFEKPEAYEKHNPANHVSKWKTPMLVIQGGLDYRVPIGQGIAAFTALQRRGIESRFLYFPDENHWVLKPQNSAQWHKVVEDWLKRWTET